MKLTARHIQGFIAKPPATCPGVLLYGEDASRIGSLATRLLDAHLGANAAAEMRLDELPVTKLRSDPALLADAIAATGFFPGPRAVRLDGASDATLKAIDNAMASWRQGDALIVVTAGILPARSKLRKFFEDHSQAAALPVYADPPDAAEVQAIMQRAGLRAPPQEAALRELVSLAATMPAQMFERFAETLVLYQGEASTPLSVEAITALAPASHDTALDQLVDLAADGARDAVAAEANRVLALGLAPTGVLIATTMRFRTMLLAKTAPDGPGPALARAKPPYFGPRRDRLMRQLQGWNADRLSMALHELLEADRALRAPGAAMPAAALVSRTLIRVASLKLRR